MKFMSAVVILALAVVAQASVIPLAGWGNPWGTHVQIAGHPAAISHSSIVHGHGLAAPWGVHAYGAPWAGVHAYAAHAIAAPVHAVHAVHAAPIHAIHGEASYVAANRGSVHTAPLPGHAISQKSLNLEPAAGTW